MGKRKLTAFLIVFVCSLVSCNSGDKTIAETEIDNLLFAVKSAGIAYDVSKENKIDSSAGLKYAVIVSIKNSTAAPVNFANSHFRLIDEHGEQMPPMVISNDGQGAMDLSTISTEINPGKAELMMLFYLVRQHGVYNLEVQSPLTGSRKRIVLPSS